MEKNQKNLKFFVALGHFPKFGPARLKKLKKFFPDPESAFNADAKTLVKSGIEENIANEFISARTSINPDKIFDWLLKENIKVSTLEDRAYPKLLKEIFDPPQILYYKGAFDENEEFNLAVVGTRKFTPYGQRVTEEITKNLAQNNLTIVSGLALGIDALAHYAALEGGGRTLAVLGSGLDRENIYPAQNRLLAERIIKEGGAIISEFPLGTAPLRFNFPQRNRIVSGMSLGTLVIEADEKSGALITARFALEQNREVFAVPGNIYSNVSRGTNFLIKEGAKLVAKADDIIEALNLKQVHTFLDNKKIIPESKEEELILSFIREEPKHVNELVRLTRLDTSRINSTLAIMEMKGMARNLGNMQYVAAR